jgi:tetratricopeptide (TPR) repeat protein
VHRRRGDIGGGVLGWEWFDVVIPAVEAELANAQQLLKQRRFQESELLFAKLVQDLENAPDPRASRYQMLALSGHATSLLFSERPGQALPLYHSLVDRMKADPSAMRPLYADAMYGLASSLHAVGQSQAAVDAFDAFIVQFRDSDQNEIQQRIARSLLQKAALLVSTRRFEEGLAAYNQAVDHCSAKPGVRWAAVQALSNRASIQRQLFKYDEAKDSLRDVVKHFGTDTQPAITAVVDSARRDLANQEDVGALIDKGADLARSGRMAESLAVADQVIERSASDPLTRRFMSRALNNKAIALATLGRHQESLAVLAEILNQFGKSPDPYSQRDVASGLLTYGRVIASTGNVAKALEMLDADINRFANTDEPHIRETIAEARFDRASMLGQMRKYTEAASAFERIVSMYGSDASPKLRDFARRARIALGVGS